MHSPALVNMKLERKDRDFTMPGLSPGMLESRNALSHHLVAE
jgi:hypothetical protein